MINLLFGLVLVFLILWTAKKFYFPPEVPRRPDRWRISPDARVSKDQVTAALKQIQRWRQEGKLSREEYDHLTDICLTEIQQLDGRDRSILE